jgi:hypothetical protein
MAGLTLDWHMGFALYDTESKAYSWKYKFSQLKGSSDDGKCKLKLHFQNAETKIIETKVSIPFHRCIAHITYDFVMSVCDRSKEFSVYHNIQHDSIFCAASFLSSRIWGLRDCFHGTEVASALC